MNGRSGSHRRNRAIWTLLGAAGGFKAWGINARLALSKQEEAHRYTVAMRTLSSTGNNADAQLYYELLNGNANIIENPEGAYTAKTTMVNGIREISLGNMRDILSSELSMGVLLSHEANRNGVDDGYEGQLYETGRAINGHLATALMLESTYGEGILGGRMSEEAAAYRNKEWTKLDELVSGYSSAEDYWKLTKKGELVDDGSGWLRDESGDYIGKDGKRISKSDFEKMSESEKSEKVVGAKHIEAGLNKILNSVGLGLDNAAYFLKGSGWTISNANYNPNNTATWYWKGNEGKTISFGKDFYEALSNGKTLATDTASLMNASMAVRSEICRMEVELGLSSSAPEEVKKYIEAVKNNFGSLSEIGGYSNAGQMLETLRLGLSAMKTNGFEMNDHIMLQFTDRVFRGGQNTGTLGLSKALQVYHATEGDARTGFLGILGAKTYQAMGMGSATEYGVRMTILDIAETMTGRYLDIDYGRVTGDNTPGSQLYSAFGMNRAYGTAATGYYEGSWKDNASPMLDCVGYVNAVYHAAGLLNSDDVTNEIYRYQRRTPEWEHPAVKALYNNNYEVYSAAVASGNIGSMVYNLGGGGVKNTYFDSRFLPTSTPLPGDLITMGSPGDEHIAIYGGKDKSGREFMYHSGPAYTSDYIVPFSSGPRMNFTDKDDPYYNEIITKHNYISRWKANYKKEYLRWLNY
jgi:hypothetical protein